MNPNKKRVTQRPITNAPHSKFSTRFSSAIINCVFAFVSLFCFDEFLSLCHRTYRRKWIRRASAWSKKKTCFRLQWRKIYRKCLALLISFIVNKNEEWHTEKRTHSSSAEHQNKKGNTHTEWGEQRTKKCAGAGGMGGATERGKDRFRYKQISGKNFFWQSDAER